MIFTAVYELYPSQTNMKDTVAVAHCLKWKWGRQEARMDQRRWAPASSMWDVRIGKWRTGATEELMGRHVRESSRRTVVTNKLKLERMEWVHTAFVKTMLQLADIRIKLLHNCI